MRGRGLDDSLLCSRRWGVSPLIHLPRALRRAPVRGRGGTLALAAALLSILLPAPAGADPVAASEGRAEAATERFALTVQVRGLRNQSGRVAVALFASSESFPDQKKALAGQLARIEGGRATLTFQGLAPGVYAAAVLHDENDNAKMDFNFLGMPLEGYGFSNDASAPFGPPSFAEAAFRLRARPSRIAVKIRYFL